MGQVLVRQLVGLVGEQAHHPLPLPEEADLQFLPAVVQSVAQQVGENAQHRPLVRPHRRQAVGQVHVHVEAAVGEVIVKGGQKAGQGGVEVHRLPLQGVFAPLQPGQVVEAGDEALKGPGPALHHRQVLPALLLRQVRVLQQLEVAQDGGQGGAQVVGDVGDLPADGLLLLPPAGLVGLAGLPQAVHLLQQVLRRPVGHRQAQAGRAAGGLLVPQLPGCRAQGAVLGPRPKAQAEYGQGQKGDEEDKHGDTSNHLFCMSGAAYRTSFRRNRIRPAPAPRATQPRPTPQHHSWYWPVCQSVSTAGISRE